MEEKQRKASIAKKKVSKLMSISDYCTLLISKRELVIEMRRAMRVKEFMELIIEIAKRNNKRSEVRVSQQLKSSLATIKLFKLIRNLDEYSDLVVDLEVVSSMKPPKFSRRVGKLRLVVLEKIIQKEKKLIPKEEKEAIEFINYYLTLINKDADRVINTLDSVKSYNEETKEWITNFNNQLI